MNTSLKKFIRRNQVRQIHKTCYAIINPDGTECLRADRVYGGTYINKMNIKKNYYQYNFTVNGKFVSQTSTLPSAKHGLNSRIPIKFYRLLRRQYYIQTFKKQIKMKFTKKNPAYRKKLQRQR